MCNQVVRIFAHKPRELLVDAGADIQEAAGPGLHNGLRRRPPVRRMGVFHVRADRGEFAAEIAPVPQVLAQCEGAPEMLRQFGLIKTYRSSRGAGGMALVGLAMVAVQVAVEQGIAEVLKISPRQQWQAAEFCRADCVARLKTNALQHLPPMGNVPVGILQDKLELP